MSFFVVTYKAPGQPDPTVRDLATRRVFDTPAEAKVYAATVDPSHVPAVARWRGLALREECPDGRRIVDWFRTEPEARDRLRRLTHYTVGDSQRDRPAWWSRGSMRFFRTRVSWSSERSIVLPDGTPAVLFVTSEEAPHAGRAYCVRLHTRTAARTPGALFAYATRSAALAALNRYAKDPATIPA